MIPKHDGRIIDDLIEIYCFGETHSYTSDYTDALIKNHESAIRFAPMPNVNNAWHKIQKEIVARFCKQFPQIKDPNWQGIPNNEDINNLRVHVKITDDVYCNRMLYMLDLFDHFKFKPRKQ